MNRFTRRVLIVIFWVALIFGVLYFPNLKVLKLEEKSITVFAWGDIFDETVIAEFEAKSGIKVNLNYYSSNEELIAKIKATGGEGYDIVVPSDFAVSALANAGLLKPLDHNKLKFWKNLNPFLLNHFFDPENRYSIPFEWELFALGVDKDYFKDKPFDPSWSLIFEDGGFKVAMINEAMQAVLFADLYLYDTIVPLDPSKLDAVKQLLIKQKCWVEAYADLRADYFLATKSCPIVVATTSYLWRTAQQFPFVDIVIPKEGTFLSVENISILAKSQKEDLAYTFINAIFEPDSIARHVESRGIFPSTILKKESTNIDPIVWDLMNSSEEQFKRYYFYRKVATEEQVRDLWVELKS